VNDVISENLSSTKRGKPDNITIVENFDSDLPDIRGDPLQLRQVFRNIIDNAFDAMSQRGKLTITTTQKNDRHVEVKFTDTGCGISKEDIENIFDPFFTKKGIGEGVGLGLSICHGIVKAHNGTIKVESEEGKGTTFIVTLPVG
jgi:signal transduction histidine kinase